MENKYPECEKIAVIADKSQVIGEFLEWLQEDKHLVICEQCGIRCNNLSPLNFSTEKLLAEFFGINLNKVEKERRQMLNAMREKS